MAVCLSLKSAVWAHVGISTQADTFEQSLYDLLRGRFRLYLRYFFMAASGWLQVGARGCNSQP